MALGDEHVPEEDNFGGDSPPRQQRTLFRRSSGYLPLESTHVLSQHRLLKGCTVALGLVLVGCLTRRVSYGPAAARELQAGSAACSPYSDNCNVSKCCSDPGMACFRKKKGWAQCKPSCVAGWDLSDGLPESWTCEQLGPHTPGIVPMKYWGGLVAAPWVADKCAALGENCYATKCCKDAGMTCFAKNQDWASCKPFCTPGLDFLDTNPDPWLCAALGERTPGAPLPKYLAMQDLAPWVATTCSKEGTNCMSSKCCTTPGMACFKKHATWAVCLASCEPGPNLLDVDASPWDCAKLGPRTPGLAHPPGRTAAWASSKCSGNTGSCEATRCCNQSGARCYAKQPGWAACKSSCSPGPQPNDADHQPWSCKQLGMRNPGTWERPTLLCWALSRSSGDEADLIRYQFGEKVSIFACEAWSVFSDIPWDLGGGTLATSIGDLTAKKGKWGSWLNTIVFVKAWHAIYYDGRYLDHDWTLKCDPDAVFFPARLKQHIADVPSTEPWCIHNSKGSTDILGPIEILNRAAMHVYFQNNPPNASGTDRALCENPYVIDTSGEDGFLSDCARKLGFRARFFPLVLRQDAEWCLPGPPVGLYVAFHPAKKVRDYARCIYEAAHPATTAAPARAELSRSSRPTHLRELS